MSNRPQSYQCLASAKARLLFKSGLNATGHRIWIWYLHALQAEGLAQAGDLQGAWSLLDEVVVRIEAGEERSHYAETLRLKGWLLTLLGEQAAAEAALRKSLDVARAQLARSWELRTATTLARLWASQGRKEQALSLLEPVFAWLTGGHATKDLVTAVPPLQELGRPKRTHGTKRSV